MALMVEAQNGIGPPRAARLATSCACALADMRFEQATSSPPFPIPRRLARLNQISVARLSGEIEIKSAD
jgi:hypothetical protein